MVGRRFSSADAATALVGSFVLVLLLVQVAACTDDQVTGAAAVPLTDPNEDAELGSLLKLDDDTFVLSYWMRCREGCPVSYPGWTYSNLLTLVNTRGDRLSGPVEVAGPAAAVVQPGTIIVAASHPIPFLQEIGVSGTDFANWNLFALPPALRHPKTRIWVTSSPNRSTALLVAQRQSTWAGLTPQVHLLLWSKKNGFGAVHEQSALPPYCSVNSGSVAFANDDWGLVEWTESCYDAQMVDFAGATYDLLSDEVYIASVRPREDWISERVHLADVLVRPPLYVSAFRGLGPYQGKVLLRVSSHTNLQVFVVDEQPVALPYDRNPVAFSDGYIVPLSGWGVYLVVKDKGHGHFVAYLVRPTGEHACTKEVSFGGKVGYVNGVSIADAGDDKVAIATSESYDPDGDGVLSSQIWLYIVTREDFGCEEN